LKLACQFTLTDLHLLQGFFGLFRLQLDLFQKNVEILPLLWISG